MNDTNSDSDLKSLHTHSLMSIMLLSSAGVFVVSGDAPQTFLIAAAGLGLSAMLRQPLERSQRSFIYLGLAAFIIAALSDQILPVSSRRFFLMPAELYCPAVIFIGVAATFFDQRESNVTAVVALSLVATMMAGNVVGFPERNERLLLAGPFLTEHFQAFYACVVAMQLSAMLLLLPLAPGRLKQGGRSNVHHWGRRLAFTAALCLTVGGVIGVRNAAFHYERRLLGVFAKWSQKVLYRRGDWIVFGDEVDLWRTVPHLRKGDKTIVLRAQAKAPPGYLRGRVFLTYQNGHWSGRSNGRSMPSHLPDKRLSFQIFERPFAAVPAMRGLKPVEEEYMGIYPSPQFRSSVLLAPGNSGRVEVVAESVSNNADGVMIPADWEEQVGYFLHLNTAAPDTAYQGPALTPQNSQDYLQVPARLAQPLTGLLPSIFGPDDADQDTRLRIAKLIKYFRANFEYELGVRMRSSRIDPVLQFLGINHKGHCELFATAAVLLLRSQGIPARYVTGFVCVERHPSEDYWLSRLEDAHAWAEAYVPELGAWIMVEATPAAGIPDAESDLGMLRSPLDRLSLAWQQFWSLMKRGYAARAIVSTVFFLLKAAQRTATHPIGGPLLVLMLLYAVRRIRRRLSGRDRSAGAQLPPSKAELGRIYQRILDTVDRMGITIPPNDTPLAVVARLRSQPAPTTCGAIADLVEAYLPLRFRAETPEQERVEMFKQEVASVLEAARREKRGKPSREHKPDAEGEPQEQR